MSEPEPSASSAQSQPSAQLPCELYGRDLRRAITAQRRKYHELQRQPGAGLRAWWNAKILGGLVAEQNRRRSRRSRGDGAPPRAAGSPDGE